MRAQTRVDRLCPTDAAVDNCACCAIMRSSRLMELVLGDAVDPLVAWSACPCMERSASMVAGLDQLLPPAASALAPKSFAAKAEPTSNAGLDPAAPAAAEPCTTLDAACSEPR